MNTYVHPTDEQVREAIRRIPTPQLRRAFYEGLKNPYWLEPLNNHGAFSNPPARVRMADGSTGDPYWPEIEYVVRVAAEAPVVATDILIGLKDSENAWVRRALFAVGGVVPASEAARLKPVVKAWLSSGFGWRTDPREMVSFAVNLIQGGELATGEWVANALFRPRARKESNKPDLVLEDYWYEVGLPRVVDALGPAGFPLVLTWLVEYEKASGQTDGWSMSRPSIRERTSLHRDVEDALIDATRDLAIARVAVDPGDTSSRLLGADLILARRIAMFALAAALAQQDVGTGLQDGIVATATQVLFDPRSKDERCRIEFAELAREVARHLPTALDPLVDFISDGPERSPSELRVQLRAHEDETASETDARVLAYTERWEHLWLASVGAAALPAPLLRRLAELDDRLGVVEDPLSPPFAITTWSGTRSPLAQEEMAAMSAEELVAHLESWHDFGDGWGPEPSHEGQARELMAFMTSNPRALTGISGLAQRLRPTYLRAILQAWEASIKANLEIDWTQLEVTVRDVLTHSDELDYPAEGGRGDDDPDFTWAKKAAVGLLQAAVKRSEPPRVPPDHLNTLANHLIDAASSDEAWAAYSDYESESGMDPLTLSLNWQWPVGIRGLAALVGYGPAAAWSDRARIALLNELERPDPRGASDAVVGENLGRLLNADSEWTESHIPTWFGGVDGITRRQQIALTTAMAVHHYHRSLLRLLSPSILAALALTEPIADGWDHHNSTPMQRIGEWAVKALIFGDVGWDDAVVKGFFSLGEVAERGAALGHIAWEFMHAETVEESIRDRFAGVWDARIAHVESSPADAAELREFHWVVRSGKFDPGWWLPRLKRALELDPELATQRYMIGKDIASAADVDPRGALDATKLLVGTRQSQGMALFDLSRNAVPMVVARALTSGDDQLKADATEFMNELGEGGFIELGKQVEAVLDGSVTQQDIPE